jgi:starch synthase
MALPIEAKDSEISKKMIIFVEILSLKTNSMDNSVKRVLFVNSEIFPYLPESPIANIGRYLPQGIQERKKEIRSFMPRYGCINERKNQLHEVIRLSGMNIVINDVDRPLVIKVASISSARMQVYFIDNDDYFHRKSIYRDDKGEFFSDNGERAIFFARGVLETIKKQRWAPDIIHCQGWISHVLPLYLKKAYIDDPIFSNSKIVLSLYDDTPKESFPADLKEKVMMGNISDKDVEILSDPSGMNLAKLAASYSDGIILGSEGVEEELVKFCKESGLPILDYNAESIANNSYIEDYNSFYSQI